MQENNDMAKLAQALADPLRLAVLQRLMEEPGAVVELVSELGESQSKVSNHLAILREQGLLKGERRGRQVIYAIANPTVAELIESLSVVAGAPGRAPYRKSDPLANARTCYDHLAGRLGVRLFDALVSAGALLPPVEERSPVELGPVGEEIFAQLGVDVEKASHARRRYAYACPDWIERRPHLGGALGAELYTQFAQSGWVRKRPKTREVLLTLNGKQALNHYLGLSVPN